MGSWLTLSEREAKRAAGLQAHEFGAESLGRSLRGCLSGWLSAISHGKQGKGRQKAVEKHVTSSLLNPERLFEIGSQEEEVAAGAFLCFPFTGSKFIKDCEVL